MLVLGWNPWISIMVSEQVADCGSNLTDPAVYLGRNRKKMTDPAVYYTGLKIWASGPTDRKKNWANRSTN